MFSFMFSVLGSLVFWVIFFIVGFFVGSILLKHIAPVTWEAITTGKRPMSREFRNLKADIMCMVLAFILVYLFWPVILIGAIIVFCIKYLFWPLLRKSVLSADKIMPNIEIKTKKQ